ncbi:MAG TPA: response regulator transcription factor [Thermoanaerobaculia bacterium]|nr:response regulator transcription factor [Thermoanaerobaculia bacterium]
MRILLVEDDPDLAAALAEALAEDCYVVDRAASGAEADELATVNEYDLVVLDWSIPPPSGVDLLSAWRQRALTFPVLMLTGRGSVEDRIHGLDAGADDYLTKPFALAELQARVRSLLRRGQRPLQSLAAGDLVMDRPGRQVRVAEAPIHLTPKEFAVLEYLLVHRDRVVSRADLSEHVWEDSLGAMSNTLEVIVSRLRKKVDGGREGRLLHTVPGVGYRLSTERLAPGREAGGDDSG